MEVVKLRLFDYQSIAESSSGDPLNDFEEESESLHQVCLFTGLLKQFLEV